MYVDFGSVEELVDALAERYIGSDKYFRVLLSESHQDDLTAIVSRLDDCGLKFFGGVFPGLIHGRELCTRGAVVTPVSLSATPRIVDLSRTAEMPAAIEGLPLPADGKPTLQIFIEALSPNISRFLGCVFDSYGNRYRYFGGGCGNRSLTQKPAVFDNSGAYASSAVLALLDRRDEVNVAHGLKRLNGPMVATRTDGNVIQELNWDNPFRVFMSLLPPEYRDVPREDFWGRVAARFAIGVHMEDSEDVIRDPLRVTTEGWLVCMSDVPENSVLYICDGQPDSMVDAAAGIVAQTAAKTGAVADCMVCDCLARNLYLGESYQLELDAISNSLERSDPGAVAGGALVLGEIASAGERAVEFHNKTLIVSVSRE